MKPLIGPQDERLIDPPPLLQCPYSLEPDFTREAQEIPAETRQRIRRRLRRLYSANAIAPIAEEIERLIKVHLAHKLPEAAAAEAALDPAERFSEKDVALITYGDLITSPGVAPFETLARFSEVFFKNLITILHILPFYPYSSHRRCAVISHTEVDPKLGTWEDLVHLGHSFRLMFDGVFNHVSSQSRWFREFLNGNPEYQKYFITFSTHDTLDEDHLHLILRPRSNRLLSDFPTLDGPRHVWTTFSRDQIDLNFKNPQVLIQIIKILLFYVRNGADMIRLDAIDHLWQELSTSCAHLTETHECVKLMRDVLDIAAPKVSLVAAADVHHNDNISYFGNGYDEAQLVYNPALSPLVLHSILTGDARKLTRWAKELEYPSPAATFFNLLDSQNGINVSGGRGILTESEIAALADTIEERGGAVGRKSSGLGKGIPEVLHTTWFSALNPQGPGPLALQIDRFIASRAIALCLRGVPGITLHSLVGSINDLAQVLKAGGACHDINRSEIREAELIRQFSNPYSQTHRIYRRFLKLLQKRTSLEAFHPAAEQEILDISPCLFTVLRRSREGDQVILAITSIVDHPVLIQIDLESHVNSAPELQEVISGQSIPLFDGQLDLKVNPYQVLWLMLDLKQQPQPLLVEPQPSKTEEKHHE